MITTIKTLIILIQWLTGLFLSLGAIGGFLQREYWAASAALIVGLALLPPVTNLFSQTKKAKNNQENGLPNIYINIIKGGENSKVEFKSTLRVDLKTSAAEKYISHTIIKTIAAFLNTEGGLLLIGVSDDKTILGLNADFNSFKGNDKQDEFQKFLDTLIAGHLGNRYQRYLKVSFPEIDEKTICVIAVHQKSATPVYITTNNQQELFYIRRMVSTVDLKPSEAVQYIKEHWKGNNPFPSKPFYSSKEFLKKIFLT